MKSNSLKAVNDQLNVATIYRNGEWFWENVHRVLIEYIAIEWTKRQKLKKQKRTLWLDKSQEEAYGSEQIEEL